MNNETIKVKKSDLKKALELSALLGRYDEIDRQKAFIRTAAGLRRQRVIKEQIDKILDEEKKEDVQEIKISLVIDREALEGKKKLSLNEILERKLGRVVEEDGENCLKNIFEAFGEQPNVFQYLLKR